MFDDDAAVKKTVAEFPRNLDTMSVGDLEEYIAELKKEIVRVEADIAKKKASQQAAAAIFKD